MNYRHIYHAGNFADVVKHTVLALILEYMKQKPGPLRVIDTHAGVALYDLSSEQAQKTGEFRRGIARLFERPPPAAAAALMQPYLGAVGTLNPGGVLKCYPGSPLVVQRLLRAQDVLVACELHPDDYQVLKGNLEFAQNAKTLELDAWMALKSLLPPRERRGLILVDPPFEEPGEFDRIVRGLAEIKRRFATGTAVIWYPVKDPRAVRNFRSRAREVCAGNTLSLEFYIQAPRDPLVLNGTGLFILNPPFVLEKQLNVILPYFLDVLAVGDGATFLLDQSGGGVLNSS